MEVSQNQLGGQLGARLTTYRPGTGRIILLGVALILLSLPCTVAGFVSSRNASLAVYANSTNSWEDWLITIGLVLGLCGIISLILAIGNRKMRVDVYEQGFAAINKQGTKEIRWDQITQVWHKLEEVKSTMVKDPKTGESTPQTRKVSLDVYAIQCADGTTCEIDTSMYGLSKFSPFIEQNYPRYLLPRVLTSYQSGTPFTAGTLTVSSSGVSNTQSNGQVQLEWGSFDFLEVDRKTGAIRIYQGGQPQPWSTIALTDTPNIAVFEALVNTVARKQ